MLVLFACLISTAVVNSEAVAQPFRPGRTRVIVGGGLFLPVGKWSEGFDSGISLGGGVDFPMREALEVGGRFSKVEVGMEDRATLSWTAMEVQLRYHPPLTDSPADLFLSVRGGLLRVALEVGEGREDEWDLLTGFGGGILLPISEEFLFQSMALWQKVLGGGQGFYFGGGLLINLP